jgi:hypothetical protein
MKGTIAASILFISALAGCAPEVVTATSALNPPLGLVAIVNTNALTNFSATTNYSTSYGISTNYSNFITTNAFTNSTNSYTNVITIVYTNTTILQIITNDVTNVVPIISNNQAAPILLSWVGFNDSSESYYFSGYQVYVGTNASDYTNGTMQLYTNAGSSLTMSETTVTVATPYQFSTYTMPDGTPFVISNLYWFVVRAYSTVYNTNSLPSNMTNVLYVTNY